MFCGSAGCAIHIISSDDYMKTYTQGWKLIETKEKKNLILLSMHGSYCNKTGVEICYKSISVEQGHIIKQK